MTANSISCDEATARGFVLQCTDPEALAAAHARRRRSRAYIGFDCTADSLHVGSLVQIMMLRLLQKHGHRPVVLLGGGTTRIGDPSGKDEVAPTADRRGRSPRTWPASAAASPVPALRRGPVRRDAWPTMPTGWTRSATSRCCARSASHFTINRMLTFDSVKLRLEREQPLTFLEFNYMILQSYDFRELSRRHGVTLQIGGSDQWGNIVAGMELTRRTDAKTVFGLTTPLITTASGAKMGKTAQGAVWLTADRLSPVRLLAVLAQHRGRRCRPLPAPVHRPAAGRRSPGWKRSAAPRSTRRRRFWRPRRPRSRTAARPPSRRGNRAPGLRGGRGGGDLAERRRCRARNLRRASRRSGCSSLAGLAASNGEARRLIRGGGARVNDAAITDEGAGDIAAGPARTDAIKLSAGRKQHRLVKMD